MNIPITNMNNEFEDFNFNPVIGAGLGMIQNLNPTPAAEPIRAKAPMYVNQEEKPTHRIALELAAKGYTIKEISELTGFTMPAIGYWLKQPNAVTMLASEVRRIHGEDEQVVQIIKENVVAAVETLAEIMQDPKARHADKIAAADRILERRYGKANQPINRNTDVDLNSLPDSELAKMLPTASTGTARV